jgi:hypothetical protein
MDETARALRCRFEGAFVALRYLLGRRDESLSWGLGDTHLCTQQLVATLASGERTTRARMLGRELGHMTLGLMRRRVDRGSR